jgi:hypothetical protein
MVAVLIESEKRGIDPDATLTEIREQIVPAVKSLPGFVSGTWLTANGYGRAVSLTLWETEPDSRALRERFGGGSNSMMTDSVVRAEVREIAATA